MKLRKTLRRPWNSNSTSGDTTYETHLEGQLEQVELSDDITLIEGGPLEGEISIGTETYHIMSSFQKRIGTEGACLGISMKNKIVRSSLYFLESVNPFIQTR